MKDTMPTWPQMVLISVFGAAALAACYFFSRLRGSMGPGAWAALAGMILAGLGFLISLFLFYLRPQYGPKAFPALLLMLAGHFLLVMLLFKSGVAH